MLTLYTAASFLLIIRPKISAVQRVFKRALSLIGLNSYSRGKIIILGALIRNIDAPSAEINSWQQ